MVTAVILCREVLYEDESFDKKELAALVVSKVSDGMLISCCWFILLTLAVIAISNDI